MNQQLNPQQQSQVLMAQWIEMVVPVIVSLAAIAMIIADVVKKIKETAKS